MSTLALLTLLGWSAPEEDILQIKYLSHAYITKSI